MEKVVVGYPHGAHVTARFHISLMTLVVRDMVGARRIVLGGNHLPVLSGANITRARNLIVQMFLAGCDADWLWMVDTDMVFDADILDRLVLAAHPVDRPIMGALCFAFALGVPRPVLNEVTDNRFLAEMADYPRDTVVEALTGTGCLLMHRRVLEAVGGAFPEPYRWFQETASPDGKPVSEDLTFCLRAKGLGFEPRVHTGIRCGHEKPVVIDEATFDAWCASRAQPVAS